MTSDDLSEALKRLDEVEQALLRLDAQATADRQRLLGERDELRDRVAALHEAMPKDDQRPTEVIRAEIDALEADADALRTEGAESEPEEPAAPEPPEIEGKRGGRLAAIEDRIRRLWSILGERE